MINSPSEISTLAVVPSPQSSFSPLGYHPRSPTDFDAGCEPPPVKRVCRASDIYFGIHDTLGTALSPESVCPSQGSSPVNQPFFGRSTTANHLDGVFQYETDSKAFLLGAMQQQQQPQLRSLAPVQTTSLSPPAPRKEEYSLIIYQQPEQYYRARYETEGIRGPLKGLDNNHPAVQIVGPPTYSGTVRVTLVHDDGTKHTSCFLDETKDRQKALTKKIDPNSNMIVEFEDLRIRRETKSKNYNKEGGRKADKTKNARNDKTARLKFIATLQMSPGHEIELTVLSNPIQLCAPPEGAELEWLIPEYGHTNGDEKVVIKGTKMTCPKVTFTILLPDGHQLDLPGHVDKEQSHQNVLVVKTPRLPDELRNYQGSTHCFKAEVRVSSGRAGTCSAPLPFFYIPNGMCHTCKQSLPPAPPAVPVQPQPIVPPFSWAIPSGMPFTTTPSPHGGNNPLQPFEISTTQVVYPRHCQETITNTPIPLSHPSVSTPSPNPTSCSGLPQLFDTTGTAHSSPSSSPGPVNSDPSNYWPLSSAPAISESQVINNILSSNDFAASTSSIQLVTSPPASEPVYSAVASPDTTSSIYPYSAYTDTANTPYPSFTS